MPNVLERIARENFRNAGYLSHPRRERSNTWSYSTPPRSPFNSINNVDNVIQRRQRALNRQTLKPSFIQACLNVFFRR